MSTQTLQLCDAKSLTVAIAGNPNSGKTTLFNALTGLRQKIANYPGVTVESKSGVWSVSGREAVTVIDLPGLYSLNAISLDEQIARDVLLQRRDFASPDVIIVTIDAMNLSRNLYLATQVIELGKPTVVALTMFDLAERNGVEIDTAKLTNELGAPTIPVNVRQNRGIKELATAVRAVSAKAQSQDGPRKSSCNTEPTRLQQSVSRYERIDDIVKRVLERTNARSVGLTERIDGVLTHKFLGPLIFLVVMLLVFQAIFSWAELPMNLIEGGFSALGRGVRSALPPGIFADLLVDGVIAGVGGVLVFLPQIMLLFLFIAILEETGYMARAAFLMDRLMRVVGLDGKAFLPLVISFACAVPAIMATRTIQSTKDRTATIMVAPFMSCSARLPVYTLMIASCFAHQRTLGFISTGALIIAAMYLLGICIAIIVACLLKRTMLKAESAPFIMELPVYRLPSVRNILQTLLTRAGLFLKKASTVIVATSILLWALAAFPRSTTETGQKSYQVTNSYAGRVGRILEPVIAPLGFDWKIGIGLISSFAARETIISTLSVVYNVADEDNEHKSLVTAMSKARRNDGTPVWTPLVSVSLMVFFVLACQCVSTLAVVRRETSSWRWPLFMLVYMLALAYAGSLITFQGGRLLGFS